MPKFHEIRCVLWLCLTAAVTGSSLPSFSIAADAAPAITPEQEKHFEEKIRPLLVTHCQECHGSKKQESGLRLDSRDALLAGGDSGQKGVVPGDPDHSLLIKAVNHVGDYQMPPKRKLTNDEINMLTEWVKIGLPWPATHSVPTEKKLPPLELANSHRQTHWAYQPVLRPELPSIQNPKFEIQNSIDAFIIAKLNEKGLTASPTADRRTLIRRLNFDLIGLPPTPAEVDAFQADKSPDAYERLVDRLLASPHFGERWARHWLDVARYGDTKGYAFQQDRRYPYAYTYRDYVIRAFNEDLPYDRFILEQLAADKLLSPESPAPSPEPRGEAATLAAMGFLTVGRRFNDRNNDIDDQIDAVSRGLLGITVACARCHDHKYDAVPTEDYYSLHGIFASSSEPQELPLIASEESLKEMQQSEEYRKYETQLAKLKDDADKFKTAKHQEFIDQSRRQSADYLAKIAAGDGDALATKLSFMALDPKDLRPGLIQRWKQYLTQHAQPNDPVWVLWHELSKLKTADFSEKAPAVIRGFDGRCNPLVFAAFTNETVASPIDVARIYGGLLTNVIDRWKELGGNAEALTKLADDTRQLAEVFLNEDSPTSVDRNDTRQYFNRADRNKYQELQKKADSFVANSPFAPPRAMVVNDNPRPTEPRVLIRGNPARPGNPVPRQFLLVVAGNERQPFANGSGRLELAQSIASPDNPLTRRVIVNRLWMHHFGEPLVTSPSDFGIRCEPPSHPQLLDALASDLLESNWSLKNIHRQLVCSATYRQASLDRPDCRAADPENRLLWRMNRRRLEFEAARDTLLAISGQLDQTMFGRAVELTKSPFPRRRAVYGFIDRQDLPNLYRVFDLASPDSSSPRRPRTTVPQQALFLMNSPFVIEQAKALAAQPTVAAASDSDAKITTLYREIFNRPPDSEELAIGRDYLTATSPPDTKQLSPLEQYAQLLLLTNEVMYVD
jgi:mono/diheme cytochrome c family protein